MDKIVINGGRKLSGTVEINGSKNAALAILAATLLTDDKCVIGNVPFLRDIDTMVALLEFLGKSVRRKNRVLEITHSARLKSRAPYGLVKKMRASVLVMGPLLARLGHVEVSLPGGCAIGDRPVNLHIDGFKKMGAVETVKDGYINMEAGVLHGAGIGLSFPSVGATENLMLGACGLRGRTIIKNAAREPEIEDLAKFLNSMGAKVIGAGTKAIEINGTDKLHGAKHEVISDRIEAGTYMIAAAITRGDIVVNNAEVSYLKPLIAKLKAAGVSVTAAGKCLHVKADKTLVPCGIRTSPFPGFPTDMQAQWMAFMCTVKGSSQVTENVFENRFLHVAELWRMGANIKVKGNRAVVYGVKKLYGAPVMASDLRASAALVLAGLAAEGKTEISRVYHIDRGYERIERRLRKLGAAIRRVKEAR